MKILLVGRGRKKTRTEYFVKVALKENDHQVYVFDDVKLSQLLGRSAVQVLLKSMIAFLQPDLVYFAKASKLSVSSIRRISAKVLTVMWYFDIRKSLDPMVLERAKQVGLFVTVSSELSKRFEAAGVKNVWHLPQAFTQHILQMKPRENIKPTDVAFIGNNRGAEARIRLLKKIGTQFQLTVWGSGWAGFQDSFIVPDKKVFNKDYVSICQNSRIVLATPTEESYSSVRHYFSNRVWLTLGSGGFLLHKYHEGMDDYFKDQKHLVFFQDDNDCLEKIQYYLSHEEERKNIAYSGQRYVLEHHTYRVRIEALMQYVSRNLRV
ncbi:MAG: glycosyltransferase [Candidatus Marinimicrobia bacterium]|nr:glycosyltransferase [Candidatus Neomarinimicrobiota bacterium]